MKKLLSVVTGVAVGVALAVAAGTYSQPFGGMGPGMGMGPGHGPMAGVDPATMVDSHLSYMKTQLKITADQESAWQAFAVEAKQQAAGMQALHAQMWDTTGTAPDRMALHAQAMQQRATGMATITDAFKALYAVLTPEQKAIADQGFGMRGHWGMPFARGAS